MFRVAALLVVASVAVAAPVPKGLKTKVPSLEGTWEAVSMTSNGRDILPGNTSVWVVSGDTLVRHARNGGTLIASNPNTPIQFKADPDRPGELDYTDVSGGRPALFRALFEASENGFSISFADQNDPRPASMKAGVYLYQFKRIDDTK